MESGNEDERLPLAGASRCLRRGMERTVVLGSAGPIRSADGGVEEYGIFVQLPWSQGAYVSLVEVEDPCRRSGWDLTQFAP